MRVHDKLDDTNAIRAGLRAACIHEYAHLVVAQRFGASGFVTIASVRDTRHAHVGWHARFQLHGALQDDEWRIVALAGSIAERIDARVACDVDALVAHLDAPGTLSGADATLCAGYRAADVAACVRLLVESWHDIASQAEARAARVSTNLRDLEPG